MEGVEDGQAEARAAFPVPPPSCLVQSPPARTPPAPEPGHRHRAADGGALRPHRRAVRHPLRQGLVRPKGPDLDTELHTNGGTVRRVGTARAAMEERAGGGPCWTAAWRRCWRAAPALARAGTGGSVKNLVEACGELDRDLAELLESEVALIDAGAVSRNADDTYRLTTQVYTSGAGSLPLCNDSRFYGQRTDRRPAVPVGGAGRSRPRPHGLAQQHQRDDASAVRDLRPALSPCERPVPSAGPRARAGLRRLLGDRGGGRRPGPDDVARPGLPPAPPGPRRPAPASRACAAAARAARTRRTRTA